MSSAADTLSCSRAAYESDTEESEESGSEWEEVQGTEAEAVLMELDVPAADEAPKAGSPPEEDEAGDLLVAADISLAANGVELRIGRRIIGAREMLRYYRQRPRPLESSAVVAAAENSRGGSGALALRGGGRPTGTAAVAAKALKRAERQAFRKDARLRLKTEMGANGAIFRGYRTSGPG